MSAEPRIDVPAPERAGLALPGHGHRQVLQAGGHDPGGDHRRQQVLGVGHAGEKLSGEDRVEDEEHEQRVEELHDETDRFAHETEQRGADQGAHDPQAARGSPQETGGR